MLAGFFIRVLNDEKQGFVESEELRPILDSVCQQFDIALRDASDYHAPGKISETVIEAIQKADVVFADANSANENVWYEIGFADRENAKKVVCLYRRGRRLPFDRTDIRAIQYDQGVSGLELLRNQIAKVLSELFDRRLRDIILDTAAGPQKAADYLSSEMLRKWGVSWLLARLYDTHEDERLRVLSLRTLGAVGALSVDILRDFCSVKHKGKLRLTAYQQAATFEGLLPAQIWDITAELASDFDLRKAYASAMVTHWLNGTLDPGLVRDLIADNSERGLRTAVLAAIHGVFDPLPPEPIVIEGKVIQNS